MPSFIQLPVYLIFTLLLIPISTGVLAEDRSPVPEPPPLPSKLQSGQPLPRHDLAPKVTIRSEKDKRVYEYRIDGQLYMVRIIPKGGQPYYFLDTNGDGELDTSSYDPTLAQQVQQWMMFRW